LIQNSIFRFLGGTEGLMTHWSLAALKKIGVKKNYLNKIVFLGLPSSKIKTRLTLLRYVFYQTNFVEKHFFLQESWPLCLFFLSLSD
jgi:hypothetical protein